MSCDNTGANSMWHCVLCKHCVMLKCTSPLSYIVDSEHSDASLHHLPIICPNIMCKLEIGNEKLLN